jgi:hypothetical protein
MARAKARIFVTRIARPRQRSRRSWKLVDVTGAVAAFLFLWWILDAPGADERRGLADWVGSLGGRVAPSLDGRTARVQAGANPTAKAQIDRPNANRNAPSSPTADLHASAARATPAQTDDLSQEAGAPPAAPSLARAYEVRDAAQFARAEIALRLALQDLPGESAPLDAEQTAEGLRIRLPTGLFAGNDAGGEAQRLIGAIAAAAAPLPNRISICAGSDEPGTAPPDWDSSFARAARARRLLEAKGVAPGRFDEISVRGGGGLAVTILRRTPGP